MLKRRRIHTSLKLKVKEKTIVTSIRLRPSLKEQIEHSGTRPENGKFPDGSNFNPVRQRTEPR